MEAWITSAKRQKANRGEAHAPHKGYVFSNAWVHQTVESICLALMVDPQGDAEIVAAQEHMQATLDRWIPIILAAQMPDGYLQTAYILADRKDWPERWSPEHRGNHEGYVSGYFIESAINHYTLTDGKDLRPCDGAKRLADCWVANIGPGKKDWFDGHQEMEQALVRFGSFVNDEEGKGRGDAYIALAKFLLDLRRGGSEYDQSHLPPGSSMKLSVTRSAQCTSTPVWRISPQRPATRTTRARFPVQSRSREHLRTAGHGARQPLSSHYA